jgi:putative Mg2+ transporter-C (MgtC) family protein
MLVAGSAALLTGMSRILVGQLGIDESIVRTDPLRIIEAVITGVSFLGAGTIIRNRGDGQVEGLTTAATLLLAGALGIGVALGQLVLTIGVTIIVLVVLRVQKPVRIIKREESDAED